MSTIAHLIGYAIMVFGGLLLIACAAEFVLNKLWEKVRDGRNLWWINKAIQHYEKIEPRPIKDES